MGKSQPEGCSRRLEEPLPIARPVEVPAGRPLMAPARAVSPEVESLLPPVGILQDAPIAPPPLARPEPGPPTTVAARQVNTLHGTGSSVVMTLAVIATAMGVGALAMIPALDGGRKGRKPRRSDQANTPVQDRADDAAASEQVPTEGGSTAASRRPTTSSTAGTHFEPATDSVSESALDAQLAEIHGLLRERSIAGATEKLRQLAARSWPEPLAVRITQTGALAPALDAFWESFDDALDEVPAGRSVLWGGQEAVLVEASQSHLILRRAGQNVRIARNELTAEGIQSLAESLLDLEDPRNQVSLGAFHFVTEGPASREARRLWQRAAEADESVFLILSLLAEP